MPRSKRKKDASHSNSGSTCLPTLPSYPGDAGDDNLEGIYQMGVLDAVVKVWCIHCVPNFSLPWVKKRQERSSGSGFCIDKDRKVILTNAHCIEWHAQVKVQRRGSDDKPLARVLAVGYECDIAVLTVDDDSFWEDMPAVKLNPKVPHLEEPVLCVGFPLGGESISVTSGVVSRIEVQPYSQAGTELLAMQIDAAINSGNSGGPAFNAKGECIGVAFQSLDASEAENIGYVIPSVVVQHFLQDLLKHSRYTGFPKLGVEVQNMENSHMRKSFGMTDKQKGVLVNQVSPTGAAAQVLKVQDVLLAFEGEEIGYDGTVKFRKHERVSWTWLVAQKFYGEEVSLTILRDGKVLEMTIPDFQPQAQLVVEHTFYLPNPNPSYLIFGGLVFTVLTVPFLRAEFGEEWDVDAPVELVKMVLGSRADFDGHQLVVLNQVLAHEITMGYDTLENQQILSINRVKVKNLRHVKDFIDSWEGEFLWFELQHNMTIAVKTEAAKKATAEVLEKHGIPAAMSKDLID